MKYDSTINNYYNPESTRENNLFRLYQMQEYKNAINNSSRPLFPFVVSLEFTNYCHRNCLFCARQVMTRPKGYMDSKLFYKILDELRENKTFIKINGYGENLLHPCCDAFITEIKKYNGLYFTTNCQNLQICTMETMIENKVDVVQISFQGTNEKDYEEQRKGSKYKKLIKNIKEFVKRRSDEEYPLIHLSTTILDEDEYRIEGFIGMCFDLGIDSVGIGRTDYDRIPWDRIKGSDRKLDIRRYRERQSLTKISDHSYLYKYCDICWDGVVVSSFFDFDQFVPVGNMNEHSLWSIWNYSEVLNALRTLEKERLLNKMKVFDTFYHAWHLGNKSYNLV